MLMAISLAEKMGSKHNLLSFSLHPGVIGTGLGDHIDWNVEYLALRRSLIYSHQTAGKGLPVLLEKVDRFMGNAEGWNSSFDFVSHDEGSATHVVAAFETDIASKHS
jgi:hypothetical protein